MSLHASNERVHELPSVAAAVGVETDGRDFLRRWCYVEHGSQDYILASRQVVRGVPILVSKTLLEGNTEGGYIEEEISSGVKQACVDLGLDHNVISHRLKWGRVGNPKPGNFSGAFLIL